MDPSTALVHVGAWGWGGFLAFVFLMLALDLGVFNRKDHSFSLREALGWTLFWIVLSLLFACGVWWLLGKEPAQSFLAGYLVEKALSVDNIFVFVVIFNHFRVPAKYQHKVLFWGILGALVMRAVFIGAGVALLSRFHWLEYVFGAFLVYTGIGLVRQDDEAMDPSQSKALKLIRRFLPVTPDFVEGRFFVKQNAKRMVTPLFVALLFVELSDVVFAVDSIPAILSITQDPFIVYTSNVFAILGLRSLYFALAGIMPMFFFLNYGLAAILVFVGMKMLIADFYVVPIGASLGLIGGILCAAVLASLVREKRMKSANGVPPP